MGNKFKVGDRFVITVDDACCAQVVAGDVGQVTASADSDGYYSVRMDDGRDWAMQEKYMKPYHAGLEAAVAALSGISSTARGCSHEWKSYVGIIDRFDFCVFCDLKRGSA